MRSASSGSRIEEAVLIVVHQRGPVAGRARRKGAIAVGLDADLLVLDEQLAVEATMVGGRNGVAEPSA